MNKRLSTLGRGRFIAAHRQFIGPSSGEYFPRSRHANKLAVGCDKSAPTSSLARLYLVGVNALVVAPMRCPWWCDVHRGVVFATRSSHWQQPILYCREFTLVEV